MPNYVVFVRTENMKATVLVKGELHVIDAQMAAFKQLGIESLKQVREVRSNDTPATTLGKDAA